MAKLSEIESYLDKLLQPGLFTDYCTNGLQVEGKREVKRICTAVSASRKAIQKSIEHDADLLLVHHGIFWNRDSYDIKGVTRDKLKSLLCNDISLIAYHLPLDAHRTLGNNWKAATDLGWTNLEPFPAKDKTPIGVKGLFPKRSFAQLCKELSAYYRMDVEAVSGGPEEVASAALISGGAHKYIIDAAMEKVDCFITGSRDEPTWHQSYENNINFAAAGHYSSEVVGIKALGDDLAGQFDVECTFIHEDNPF